MFSKVKSSFSRSSNDLSEGEDRNGDGLGNPEKITMNKVRAVLYDEAITYSENNTYYKMSNVYNCNNMDSYIDYVKRSNYTRSYEQEMIYNEALSLYNNRNKYIRKKYQNNFYVNIKRNLRRGRYFGDDNDDLQGVEAGTENNLKGTPQPMDYTHERNLNEYLYREKKKEQAILFRKKYMKLFAEGRFSGKGPKDAQHRRKILLEGLTNNNITVGTVKKMTACFLKREQTLVFPYQLL